MLPAPTWWLIGYSSDHHQHDVTRIVVKIRNKAALSFYFASQVHFLSAFLDALTVTAVLIRLSYMQMVMMALPYAIVLGGVGAAAIIVAF